MKERVEFYRDSSLTNYKLSFPVIAWSGSSTALWFSPSIGVSEGGEEIEADLRSCMCLPGWLIRNWRLPFLPAKVL